MARYTGPRVRICRRLGAPIFGPSKYFERRKYPPGMHGRLGQRKLTEYALALIEKQKLRFSYGLTERQFHRVYEKALRKRGVTGETMLQILETRLDNVVYRLGFAPTRPAARQMVVHGHIMVNGRKVTIPSYAVGVGDVIEVRNKSSSRQLATRSLERPAVKLPAWLSLQKDLLRGVVLRLPTPEEAQPLANVQTVVEFYSKV